MSNLSKPKKNNKIKFLSMKKYLLIMLLICQLAFSAKSYSQNIAVNSTGSLPDTSAMLDVSSTTKGFLTPRMTTAQQNAIPLPAKGLLVFNTTDNAFKVNIGTPAVPNWIAFQTAPAWALGGNTGVNSGNQFLGSINNASLRFRTNNTEKMVLDSTGNVGIGVNNPGAKLVVKDSMEIRRIGSVSQLIFTNTASSGDFRIGGDGGDIFWQGGGGRSLQMGSYWATILGGDRQTSVLPAFINGVNGTSVIVAAQRDASVALGIQANSASQTANLTEWRNSAGTALSAMDESGNLGLLTSNPTSTLQINGSLATAVVSVNSNYTLTATNSLVLVTTGGNNRTITLPAASGCTGRIYTIKQIDSGTDKVTIDANGSEKIDGALTSTRVNDQWKSVTVQSDGSNWYIIGKY